MGIITLILNSIILFIVSNTYILDKTYDYKISFIYVKIDIYCLLTEVIKIDRSY